jgi:hypothetical protein
MKFKASKVCKTVKKASVKYLRVLIGLEGALDKIQ